MNFTELVTSNGLFCDGDWIEKKDQDPNGNVRLIQLADIGVCEFKDKSNRFVTESKAEELHCTYLRKGDILIARLPDPLGRACIFPFEGKYITAVDVAIVRIARDDVNPKYVMYMINSGGFRAEIKKYESGTTRKRISRKNLDKIEFELPSLTAQNRIVARIEELFSELDNGVETLRKTKQQLAVYRQAVLKDAFSEVSLNEYLPLRTVIVGSPQNGLYKPKSAYGSGTRILRIDGFYDGKIAADYDFKRLGLSESEIEQYRLNEYDLIVNRVNSMPYLGKCALVRNLAEVTVYESNMMRMRLDTEKVDPEYVTHYLSSFVGRKELTKNAKQAVNQASINQTDVGNALIPIPASLAYQRKVVASINARMSVCDSIEKTVDTALQQAEAMRQSILKKAFEGR